MVPSQLGFLAFLRLLGIPFNPRTVKVCCGGSEDSPAKLGDVQRKYVSRATFPILSRDPSFQETINKREKTQGHHCSFFEKNDG